MLVLGFIDPDFLLSRSFFNISGKFLPLNVKDLSQLVGAIPSALRLSLHNLQCRSNQIDSSSFSMLLESSPDGTPSPRRPPAICSHFRSTVRRSSSAFRGAIFTIPACFPVPVKSASLEKKQSRSFSDLSDSPTPRTFEDSRNISIYTNTIAFTLFELETITKRFRSDYVLGEGGFGTVYKGYIDENVRVGLKSLPVAVKVLNKDGLQGHREWLVSSFLFTVLHCSWDSKGMDPRCLVNLSQFI